MVRRGCALLGLALAVTACSGGPVAQWVAPTAAAPSSAAPATTPTAVPTSTSPPVVAAFTVRRVTAADLPRSWRPGCPVAPAQLRRVTVPYAGFDGRSRRGDLVVHQRVADEVGRTFVRLRDAGFPIRSITLVDEFGGSDDESMAADNTSAFNCRAVVGGSGGWSRHAYGTAIDINPRENPYVYGDGTVAPPEGRAYVDRSPYRQGMVVAGGAVDRAFAAIGWSWGGRFRSSKDYQHFSESGR
ncbi:MAG: M15 family metallopeptidase [Mycobacteriales bacterium]|nr:M15 family metallopeptidase [Mycobacteriales bacterium]